MTQSIYLFVSFFTDIEVVIPVEFGPVNYVLLVLSGIVGLGLVAGLVVLCCKECERSKKAKLMYVKEKLNVRRKAISGISSLRRGTSSESISVSEATSYIQLTETPTSLRCSSAWTPSPITRISVSDTPTSGNFSI